MATRHGFSGRSLRKQQLFPIVAILVAGLYASGAGARGVTPYLPLNLAPEIERQIERVLILGGKTVVRRPIPAALVNDALPEACKVDRVLCSEVRVFLDRYIREAGVTMLQVNGGVAVGDSDRALPNAHGRTVDSNWQLAAAAFYQPNDYLLLNIGGIAHDGEAMLTGTTLSTGFEFAQLDIGYRDHWLSTMPDSSFPLSTEAPTMPSITLSSYTPFTPLGITYEVFTAQMSRQEDIRYYDSYTSGEPQLTGVQVGFAPAGGYALTLNRVMQHGGGARGSGALADFIDAIFDNAGVNQGDTQLGEEFGNQIASLAVTQLFPASIPFAVHIEYAGEDNSYGGNYRLGDVGLSLGIDFPLLGDRYDLGFEVSEWQNAWYVHHIYPEGMTNEGFVIGHWFGDQRQYRDQVGGWSALLQAGYRTTSGKYWRASYRTLDFVESRGFQTLPEYPYEQLHEISLQYSSQWRGFPVSAELVAGRDALGESFGRLMGTFDLSMGRSFRLLESVPRQAVPGKDIELYLQVGANSSDVYQILSGPEPDSWTGESTGYHLAAGARRQVSAKGDLGVGLEFDGIDGRSMVSVRALDYRYRATTHFAVNGFLGVGRYDRDAPAYGWYAGAGLQWRNLLPQWDLGFDWRSYDKLSRNRVASGDPSPVIDRPRIHFNVQGWTLSLSRHF